MKALVVYCHPCEESFNAAVRDTAIRTLEDNGHEVRLLDLYKEGFNPVMSAEERRCYNDKDCNIDPVADQLELIRWADMLVFVYPTWWFGLPAMLKGWLDRVWIPHETFQLPEGKGPLKGCMENVKKIAIVTTCGATWLQSKVVGEPGRKTIARGLRYLCCPNCNTLYLAHYKMDASTPQSRKGFLAKVERKLAHL
ncbi:MAG: NAD(P)H-dependent oxidoreductase [Pseudomonadota bacterium]